MRRERRPAESYGHVRGVRVGAQGWCVALLLLLTCVLCEPLFSQKRPPGKGKTPPHSTATPTPTPRRWPPRPTPTPAPTPRLILPELRQYEFALLVIDAQGVVRTEAESKARASYYVEELGGAVTMEMVKIERGTFQMGTADANLQQVREEHGRYCREGDCPTAAAPPPMSETPRHTVTVASFYMGRSEVTQEQWEAVARLPRVKIDLSRHPSSIRNDPAVNPSRPVESISWREAVEFCERLSRKTGRQYRLPTEAEWEYASRGGAETQFAFGDTVVHTIANYNAEYPYSGAPKKRGRGTTRPSKFSPDVMNRFGLYDMVGNVSEWCLDNWHDNYKGAPSDGTEWKRGSAGSRVVRDCSWTDPGYMCRSAYRQKKSELVKSAMIGLRVVMTGKPSGR